MIAAHAAAADYTYTKHCSVLLSSGARFAGILNLLKYLMTISPVNFIIAQAQLEVNTFFSNFFKEIFANYLNEHVSL